ncbi:TPA: YqgE/AlgH family protein [Proteus mirabilis]|uniref:YqgE/AlgH family protein n=1 Tax=Proteus mirabilis TaxID=584 RepID=UPI001BA13695|nr:YqgE/AlgH family protein [Proteus mirabilis]MDM3633664.1 YqgE/AlgH family protein [Proteus mirabilis]HBC5514252.1 YqgE/AlgH family protein [Proteus mirabilis]HBC5902485.1 YqgE/AlgH family protein [Proteus mirabilis]HBC5904121.1 YqgE/AlgH family protein [Proteus mirabilis]HEK1834511.1 YqgE/AlgH family protein [Proteus mirabilis]
MNLLNHFLIAMPSLSDPLFQRSVVYVCEHNENGAMGLVINKPIEDISIESVLEQLEIFSADRDSAISLQKPVMSGGPVAEEHGFILHTPVSGFSSSIKISDSTMITTSKDVLETLGTARQPEKTLVSLGYSSWEKGQLEREILENSWLTVEATPQIIFGTPIAERWHKAAELIGIDIHTISPTAGHA